jgi:hypothetical protein
MRGGFLPRGEKSGAFESDVDIELFMRQCVRIADCGHLDGPGTAIDRVVRDLDDSGKPAMYGIEPQQMGVGLDRAEIVDCDNLNVCAIRFGNGAQDIPAYPSKSVDSDFNRHSFSFSAGRPAGTSLPAWRGLLLYG